MGTAQRPDPTESVRHQLPPLFDQIVIKELDQDRVRRSGLVVPPGTHEPPPEQGIVLAVGPGLDWWANAGVHMPVAPGDHVVFPAAAGSWVEVDEERLLVCRVGGVLGWLEDVRQEAPGRGWRSAGSGCWSAASASFWACSRKCARRRATGPENEVVAVFAYDPT